VAKEEPHSKLIAAAAKRQLAPLGLTRKGRSRTWLDDRGWFVTVVEFQPSGFSRGSYLNVGAHFLWAGSGFLSFDLGYRTDLGFVSFRSVEQFTPHAERLAVHAAAEVQRLRAVLTSPAGIAAALPEERSHASWATYHRAVAQGLTGQIPEAAKEFDRLVDPAEDYPWIVERAQRCRTLRDLLPNQSAFREAIDELIATERKTLRLPEVVAPLNPA
jgi:hypothetical protein